LKKAFSQCFVSPNDEALVSLRFAEHFQFRDTQPTQARTVCYNEITS